MELHAGVAFTKRVSTTLGLSSMTSTLRKRAASSSCIPTTQVMSLRTRINPPKKGKSLLLTFYEGFSPYSVFIPLWCAVKRFTLDDRKILHNYVVEVPMYL